MKTHRHLTAIALAFSLAAISLAAVARAQEQVDLLLRGRELHSQAGLVGQPAGAKGESGRSRD